MQSIGLVDSHLIDHCSAIFDDPVEKVVGLPCFQAMLANLQVKSCIHVHRSGLDLSSVLWLHSSKNDLTAVRVLDRSDRQETCGMTHQSSCFCRSRAS